VLTGRRIVTIQRYRAARAELLQRFVLQEDQFWTGGVAVEALRHRARVVGSRSRWWPGRAGNQSREPPVRLELLEVIVQTWLR
jgi:hypothetical protein